MVPLPNLLQLLGSMSIINAMRRAALVILTILTLGSFSRGQSTGGGVVAYDPEISTVQAGAVTDVQAVVSYDRKYVTLTFGGQESRPIAMYEFPVIFNASSGFVGGALPTGQSPGGAIAMSSPAEIDRHGKALRSILSHQGTFLLASTSNSQ